MSGRDDYEDDDNGGEELTADQRDALDQLHARMTHEIAEAHLTGDKDQAEETAGYRRMVSDGLSVEPFVAEAPRDSGENAAALVERADREDLEDRRAELTRELHEAVANKDSRRAGRLDRERGDLTEELYGNGDIVGAGGRSL
jgi:hypothetical protein